MAISIEALCESLYMLYMILYGPMVLVWDQETAVTRKEADLSVRASYQHIHLNSDIYTADWPLDNFNY